MCEGNIPAINVKNMLITTSAIPPIQGSFDSPLTSVRDLIMRFIGMFSKSVIMIPRAPAIKPIVMASALNTCEISFFEAPIARRIPISFVLSRTEMYVMNLS